MSDGRSATNKYGQKQKPLVTIPIHDVVMDELHLVLQITDVLTSALIKDFMPKKRRFLPRLMNSSVLPVARSTFSVALWRLLRR